MSLLSLPLEIRDMIYHMVLTKDSPIVIRSPIKRPKPTKRRIMVKNTSSGPKSQFGAILSTNKQIQAEASRVFYSVNQFTVGSGSQGSTKFANLHGLKAFIAAVPSRYISSIKHIILVIYLQEMYTSRWWHSPNHRKLSGFASASDAFDVKSTSRILVKHFNGLESMVVSWDHTPKESPLPVSVYGSGVAVGKAMKILVKHPSARQILVRSLDWVNGHTIDLQDVVETVAEEELESGRKAISVEECSLENEEAAWWNPGRIQYHLKW